jgi:hypothetical protein
MYKDKFCIKMSNVKIIIIKSVYRSAWQKLRDKLQANVGERKHINTEVDKQTKNEEKYTKIIITKNDIT